MDSLTTFSFILASLILFSYIAFKKTKVSKPQNLPPGPRTLPLIGNIHQLAGSLPHRALKDLAEKYGPIMHLKLGNVSTIVVSSPRLAKKILKTHDIIFADRPKMECTKILYYDRTDIAASLYGDYWRQMKKICTLELLSEKKVKSFGALRDEELGRLCESLRSSSGTVVNFTEMVVGMINNVICRATLGNNYKAQDQAVLIKLIKDLLVTSGAFNVGEFFPRLKFLNSVMGIKRKWLKIHKELDKVLEDVLEDHKGKRGGGIERIDEDLVDVLLRIKEGEELETPITFDNVKAVLLDMFAAGTDTSSATIIWAMAEMMRNQRVLKKAQEEIREPSNVTKSGTNDYHYLKLVIKETLRLHAPVPLLVPRESRQQCTIDGYDIPAKTKVVVNAFACALDLEYWEDPESFIPERFENSSINFIGNDYEFIPFGAGRRMCPGITFGTNSVESTLVDLLHHFDWKLPKGMKPQDINMEESDGITTTLKTPLLLVPIARPAIAFAYELQVIAD
ncbi:hypothetical protein LXL04_027769 [Taraxacum kok-saghyz]